MAATRLIPPSNFPAPNSWRIWRRMVAWSKKETVIKSTTSHRTDYWGICGPWRPVSSQWIHCSLFHENISICIAHKHRHTHIIYIYIYGTPPKKKKNDILGVQQWRKSLWKRRFFFWRGGTLAALADYDPFRSIQIHWPRLRAWPWFKEQEKINRKSLPKNIPAKKGVLLPTDYST